MTRHPRIPAFAALTVASAVGLGLFAATGQFHAADLSRISLDELQKRIVDCKEGGVWRQYGDKLVETGAHQKGLEARQTFSRAAKAYQKAVEFQPELDDARANIPYAWGLASDTDAFFASFARLTTGYPKIAVDLLQRPGLEAMQKDPRWEPAAASARAQAAD